jgi:hypothetical protein
MGEIAFGNPRLVFRSCRDEPFRVEFLAENFLLSESSAKFNQLPPWQTMGIGERVASSPLCPASCRTPMDVPLATNFPSL